VQGGVMALEFGARIDRRRAIAGMLAAGGAALLSPERAQAVAVPAPEKAYAAFFLGQGGYLFSWGMPYLASRALGLETDVFGYTDVPPAWKKIVRRRNDGYKIALIGYSLGNTTITYLQTRLEVDLLLAIAESSLGRNHPIKKQNTRRAVLWYGPGVLSNAGLKDGFDVANYIENSHLLMNLDPRVVNGVLGELKDLIALEKIDATVTAQANAAAPQAASIGQIEGATAAGPAPRISAGWLPPSHVITPDVTCTNCWGFRDSLVGPEGADFWMR
jgi:hypothetical protein